MSNSHMGMRDSSGNKTHTIGGIKKSGQNYNKYMDKMNEALNRNIEKNIFPYWRNHQSLKGWCSMNYPSILGNPMLKKYQRQQEYDKIKFSNQERPISAPNIRVAKRPFTGTHNIFKQGRIIQTNESQDKFSQIGSLLGQTTIQDKSIMGSYKLPTTAINTVERVVSAMPQPKKTAAQKKKEADTEAAAKKAAEEKMKKGPVSFGGITGISKLPPNETNESALQSTNTWNNIQNISKKLSVGTLSTAKYFEKAQVFDKMNDKASQYSQIAPQSNFFGQPPDPNKDPYDRRKVKQLDDISFEESEEDEYEDVRCLKRLPRTILTEDAMKQYLGELTERVMLEHHYWVKDSFLDKIGRMAPNLKELSLRRMNVSNKAFLAISRELKQLRKIDISDCKNIEVSSVKVLIKNNVDLQQIQASNCIKGFDDSIVTQISETQTQLTFLDLSFNNQITDEGLLAFNEKNFPITKLFLNGLTQITSAGLSAVIKTCQQTLKVFEATLMPQEGLNGQFCHDLSFCFNLEELDLTGDANIADDGILQLPKGDIKNEEGQSQILGLKKLKILKLNGLSKISDIPLFKLCQTSQVLEHIELTKCESITEYSIDMIIKNIQTLKFIDLNSIPAINQKVLEQIKNEKPDLLIRRFLHQVVDPKDNGLRIPRIIISDKKKKKKKKKSKKKK